MKQLCVYGGITVIIILWIITSTLLINYFDLPTEIQFGEGTDILAWLMFFAMAMMFSFTLILSTIIFFVGRKIISEVRF